jgi:hypothetical protein
MFSSKFSAKDLLSKSFFLAILIFENRYDNKSLLIGTEGIKLMLLLSTVLFCYFICEQM